MKGQSLSIALSALALTAIATPIRRTADSSVICNLAWSNSGHAKDTDCTGADIIFADPKSTDPQVLSALQNPNIDVMAYLSVGTVNPEHAPDPRLVDLAWEANKDKNSEGGFWGDYFFNPADLNDKVLPIIKEIIYGLHQRGFTWISTDNAKPSTAVTDNDKDAELYQFFGRIDAPYVEYMHAIVEYAHSLGMRVTLKNPSYYVNEKIIHEFDAYIIESMFNFYPWDADTNAPILNDAKPLWLFQYPGINDLTEEELKKYMLERDIHTVYMDSNSGYHQIHT